MTKQQAKRFFAAFEDARFLLNDLESALAGALDNEIDDGRLSTKKDCAVAELQWPYETYLPQLKKSGSVALRLYLEIKVPIQCIDGEAESVREAPRETTRDGDGFA